MPLPAMPDIAVNVLSIAWLKGIIGRFCWKWSLRYARRALAPILRSAGKGLIMVGDIQANGEDWTSIPRRTLGNPSLGLALGNVDPSCVGSIDIRTIVDVVISASRDSNT